MTRERREPRAAGSVVGCGAQLREVLRRATFVSALCHENPDADTIGGAVAMALIARRMGIASEVVCPDGVPPVFEFLSALAEVRASPSLPPDVVVVCDAATLDRTGRVASQHADWLRQATVVNIDHHATNTFFGSVNCVDPDAAATCEIIAKLLPELGVELDAELATSLLAGIVRDSLGFADRATSPRTMRVAAELMEAGADLPGLQRRILGELPYPTLALWGKLLNSVESGLGGRVVFTTLSPWMLEATGTQQHDADGVAEFIAKAKGSEVAVLLREIAPGQTRVSVRVSDRVNAAEIVQPFGGGGHRRRAGAIVDASPSEVITVLLTQCERLLNSPTADGEGPLAASG